MKLKTILSWVLSFLIWIESIIQVYAVNGSISYSPEWPNWTNSDVTVTLTGDYDNIDNNGWADTYVFTDNGSFDFEYSLWGTDTGSITANVDRIDKTSPDVSGVSEWEIYTGTVSINFSDDHLSGATLNGNPYNNGEAISDINTYTFIAEDVAGNTTTVNFQITSPIDIIAPTATIIYTPDSATTGEVIAEITGFSEEITGLNATGYTFTDNGSFDFIYRDLAGNTGTTTANVNRIDTTAPTATIIYSLTGTTNQDVVASISGFSEEITGLNTTEYTFTDNGSFDFTYQDMLGNIGTTTAIVNRIDKAPITASISYSPSSRTNGNVTATIWSFNKADITVIGWTTHLFSANGTYIFEYEDLAGNTGSMQAEVNWIDKTIPTFAGITDWATYNTTQYITFSDNNPGYTATLNGNPYNSGDPITGRWVQHFEVIDVAGNLDGATFTLDTTTPTITLNGSSTINLEVLNPYTELWAIRSDNDTTGDVSDIAWIVDTNTLGNYTRIYSYWDGQNTGSTTRNICVRDLTPPVISLNGSSLITIERTTSYTELWATRSDNYDGTGDISSILWSVDTQAVGSYILTYSHTDTSGNTGSTTRTIDVVDTTSPTASIIYSLTGLTNQDTIATITGFSEEITGLNNANYTFTSNGTYTFTYQDLAGNIGSTTATVNRIDKTTPTATVDYLPGGPTRTNGSVFAEITGFSEDTTGLNTSWYLFITNGSFVFTYQDLAGNTGENTATVNRIDITAPTVSQAYISLGNSGLNGANTYYNGDIILSTNISDAWWAGLNGSTCEYSLDNGITRNSAIYNTTTCTTTTLSPASTINVQFRIVDNANNTTTGINKTFFYDNTPPTTTATPASSTGNQDIVTTLSPTDAGIGVSSTLYCIDTSNSCTPVTTGTSANVTGAAGTAVAKYVRYLSIDKLNNTESIQIITYTIDKILPTITGSTTVYSDNTTNTSYAKIGDTITLLFTTNRTLAALPTLSISGGSASFAVVTDLGSNSYSASYTMKSTDIEGTTKFILNMIDTVNNTGTSIITGIIFDKTSPSGLSITAPILGHYVNGSPATYNITWNTGTELTPTNIKLEYSTTNFASSILITWATANNGSYTFLFPNTLDTIGKIRLTATDSAGNTSIITGTDFIFDNTAPTDIAIDYPGLYIKGNTSYTLNRNGWLDANPSSITIYYSTNGTTYTAISSCTKTNNEQSCTWTTPALNSATVTLRAIAKDKLNQTKLWTTPSFTIDSTLPTLTFTGNSNRRTTAITASATATDTLAGLSGTVMYNTIPYTTTCDNGSSTAPYYDIDGIRTGYACISDKAGNVRTGAMTYKIDQTAPTLTLPTTSILTNTWVSIAITGEDTTSGLSGFVRSKLSGTGTINFSSTTGTSSTLSANTDGEYIIQVVAKDNANNISTGTFTFIRDTTGPNLSGWSVTISNQTATYTFTSDTTGAIVYSGTCGTGSLTTASAAENTTSRTLANGTYSGCTLSISDTTNNTSTLIIPDFTINYTAPAASGGGGWGGGGWRIAPVQTTTGTTLPTTGSSDTTGNLSVFTPQNAYTYASENNYLPSSRQRRYVGTGIVTKSKLKTMLTTRNRVIKKSTSPITIYSSTGTSLITRENVAKTLIKFFLNITPSSSEDSLELLKNNAIITNTSYPKNRELNQNLLTMLARFFKQTNWSGTIDTSTGSTTTIKSNSIVSLNTTTKTIWSSLNDLPSRINTNFQFTVGYTKNKSDIGVKYLQYLLTSLWYYQGDINGTNNKSTIEALFKRQSDNKLVTKSTDPAAGYLGPKTRDALNILLKNLLSK